MDDVLLVRKFMDADMQLTQDALDALRRWEDIESVAERVLASLKKMESRPFLVTAELITKILEGNDVKTGAASMVPPPRPSPPEAGEVPRAKEIAEKLPERTRTKFKPKAGEFEPRVEVLKDITGRSYTEGDLKDFVNVFRDRYERLSRILQKRVDFHDAVPISNLRSFKERALVKVVGMVLDKRETSGGHVVLEVEDLNGRTSAWVFKGQRELMRKAAEVVVDEIIGIVGDVRSGDRAPRLLVRDIIWPDLPVTHEFSRAEDPACAALISDLHVGSEMFLEDVFMKFVSWLRGEVGNTQQQALASRVKYLVIAGDIVDGVGVYPQQEEELLIHDIIKQYDAAAQLLAQVPEHITIIIAPGNHDAVRPSEPQPSIQKDIAGGLYDLNSVMVGNPAWVSLHGINFLVYHGRSFDDLIATMPGLNRQKSTPPMIKLLQKRHLAPVYGGRTAISPEPQDYLVIEEAPDVFHCGHMHVYGYERYRGVEVVNSGTFQETTIYMRRLGVKPTPGIVPVIDLQTHQARVIHFA
jgi:DNA polymerase II small subunit